MLIIEYFPYLPVNYEINSMKACDATDKNYSAKDFNYIE